MRFWFLGAASYLEQGGGVVLSSDYIVNGHKKHDLYSEKSNNQMCKRSTLKNVLRK